MTPILLLFGKCAQNRRELSNNMKKNISKNVYGNIYMDYTNKSKATNTVSRKMRSNGFKWLGFLM